MNSKENSHKHIVKEILPEFAERLKREGLISGYETEKCFKIPMVEQLPPFITRADLILHVPGEGKVLVEVANPEKPKRFMGELVYPHVLGNRKEIVAAIIFVLGRGKKAGRGLIRNILLYQFLDKQQHTKVMGWAKDHAYWNLKYTLKQWFPS